MLAASLSIVRNRIVLQNIELRNSIFRDSVSQVERAIVLENMVVPAFDPYSRFIEKVPTLRDIKSTPYPFG